jgi:hypothetical protein
MRSREYEYIREKKYRKLVEKYGNLMRRKLIEKIWMNMISRGAYK